MSETTELTWNTDGLKHAVKPYITGACTELIFASASISSLPTPKGCENAKKLYETVDKIKTKVSEIEADVQDAADGLEQNEKNIEDFLEDMWNGFKDLFNGNKDPGTNNDEEKLKDPLSENNPFKGPRGEEAKRLAQQYNIDTRGKTAEQIIAEAKKIETAIDRIKVAKALGGDYLKALAEKYGVETTKDVEITTTTEEKSRI